MERKQEADRAVERIKGMEFFGKRVHAEQSKKPFIQFQYI